MSSTYSKTYYYDYAIHTSADDAFRSRNSDAARQEAIKIIRARRLAATDGSQKQSGNTKIKLALPKAKPPTEPANSPVKGSLKSKNEKRISDVEGKQIEARKKPQISKKYAGVRKKQTIKAAAEQPQ